MPRSVRRLDSDRVYLAEPLCVSQLDFGKAHERPLFGARGGACGDAAAEVLFRFLATKWPYRLGFRLSLAFFLLAIERTRRLAVRAGFPVHEQGEERELAAARKRLAPSLRAALWRSELVVMLCENALFTSFVTGMASGL